ncbi:prolyl oligopeptidase family serine peptidase [Roseobacter sp.]|uniref:alpha/beta hydrolase family esterase n=1 Tax=Roseobacter sp. TaxID=1907202 RepID=UPI0025DB8412|nr:prolyl oligopeptidase family serine peptidase [Roseobacter sp.]
MRHISIAATIILAAGAAQACGSDTDCMIGDRSYRIAMPEGHDGTTPVPAIAFAHGYRGSAAGVMRNGSLRGLADELGAALIAFNSVSGTWQLPYHPSHMEADGSAEFAYVDAVLADAARRFAIDSERIMATGFSSGGMMTWNLACSRSAIFAGFVPVAGTFWMEPPESCGTPVTSIIHIHGDNDSTVPLDGRVIGPSKQGEVDAALAMYSDFGGFAPVSEGQQYGTLTCDARANDAGDMLTFCLFEGGHSFRTEFVRFGWQQLKEAGRL